MSRLTLAQLKAAFAPNEEYKANPNFDSQKMHEGRLLARKYNVEIVHYVSDIPHRLACLVFSMVKKDKDVLTRFGVQALYDYKGWLYVRVKDDDSKVHEAMRVFQNEWGDFSDVFVRWNDYQLQSGNVVTVNKNDFFFDVRHNNYKHVDF